MSRLRACWVVQSPVGCFVMRARRTRRVSSSIKNSTYQRRNMMVSTVKKSVATIAPVWDAMNCHPDGPVRSGVGPRSAVRRIFHTVDAAIQWPSLTSSPWMRRYPHVGFSSFNRNTNRRHASAGDLPVTVGSTGVRRDDDADQSRSLAGRSNITSPSLLRWIAGVEVGERAQVTLPARGTSDVRDHVPLTATASGRGPLVAIRATSQTRWPTAYRRTSGAGSAGRIERGVALAARHGVLVVSGALERSGVVVVGGIEGDAGAGVTDPYSGASDEGCRVGCAAE